MAPGRRWGRGAPARREAPEAGAATEGSPSPSAPAPSPPVARPGPPPRAPRRLAYLERGQRYEVILSQESPLPLPELSEAALEYRDGLRAQYWRALGRGKEEVAAELGRALGWVTRCWQTPPEQVKRPREVPPYIAEYELRMLKSQVEPFRPPDLRRRYVQEAQGLYEECVQQMPWRQAVFRSRNYKTGEVTVTNIASSRQDSSYPTLATGIARLDEALSRVRQDFNIVDPNAYLLNNWYPDGKTSIAPHNHDFWSAILSFGAPRVFLLDGQPLLLGEGDLLVFGTQRHSVPRMPEVQDGRVSVAIFWRPEAAGEEIGFGEFSEGEELPCAGCGSRRGPLQEPPQQRFAGEAYCQDCWAAWRAQEEEASAAEEALLAAALERSLVER